MHKYVSNPDPKKSVRVYGRGTRVSAKESASICRAISGLPLPKGRKFLERLVEGVENLRGKHHTGAALEISGLLKSAEANTEFKGLAPERMVIHASAHKGFSFATPRRFKQRGKSRSVTNIQVILEQR